MNFTYSLTLDETYFQTLIDRYYKQRSLVLRPQWQFGIIGILLAIALPLLPFDGGDFGHFVIVMLLYGVIAIGALSLMRKLIFYHKFRYTSYFGKSAVSTVSDQGLKMSSSGREHLTDWSEFKSAASFPDGIMLLRRGIIWWLPNAALEGSIPSEVAQFLSTKMPIRVVA